MRLIFLHGIHQNGRDPAAMTREWIADLEVGLGRPGALSTVDVVLPFYGDALVAAAQLRSGAIAQGGGADADRELARFLADGLEEQAAGAGVPRAEIAAEQEAAAASGDVVPQGFPMDRRINAIVNILERISPLRGDLALRLLGQAHAYLRKPHVRRAVNDLVRPALAGGPMVLVTHSLGTIVGFALLREAARAGARAVQVDAPARDAARRVLGGGLSDGSRVRVLQARDGSRRVSVTISVPMLVPWVPGPSMSADARVAG